MRTGSPAPARRDSAIRPPSSSSTSSSRSSSAALRPRWRASGSRCTGRRSTSAAAASSCTPSARSTSRSGTCSGSSSASPSTSCSAASSAPSLPAYASWLYATEDLDALAAEAAGWAAQGFRAVKQRLPHGPLEGKEGIRRNVELVRTVVEAVGPDVDVMADAYMSWDVGYAIRCIRAFEDAGLRLRWVEEPLVPDDIPGLARVRAVRRDADRRRRARGDALRLPPPRRGRRRRRPPAGREPARRDHRGAARLGARRDLRPRRDPAPRVRPQRPPRDREPRDTAPRVHAAGRRARTRRTRIRSSGSRSPTSPARRTGA